MLMEELDNAKKLSVFHVIANSTKIYIADCSDFCSYVANEWWKTRERSDRYKKKLYLVIRKYTYKQEGIK